MVSYWWQNEVVIHSPFYWSTSFFFLRERGRKGEGEKHKFESEASIGCLSYTPHPRTKPTIQACALTRNWTGNLSVHGTMPNPLSHTGQGSAKALYYLTLMFIVVFLPLPCTPDIISNSVPFPVSGISSLHLCLSNSRSPSKHIIPPSQRNQSCEAFPAYPRQGNTPPSMRQGAVYAQPLAPPSSCRVWWIFMSAEGYHVKYRAAD